MLTDKKVFNAEDAEWSSRAERELRGWLRSHGYKYDQFPNGKFGFDGKAHNEFEEFIVEIERRKPSRKGWTQGSFPFRTVDIPTRRRPSVEKQCLFFTFRADVRAAVVVFPKSIREDRTKRKNTTVTRCEEFFAVPMGEVLPIDLTEESGATIAELNADRIRSAVSSGRRIWSRECLGDEAGYGLTVEEWKQLGDELEKPLASKFCLHQRRHREPDWHRRPGWFTEVCDDCGAAYGHGPNEANNHNR